MEETIQSLSTPEVKKRRDAFSLELRKRHEEELAAIADTYVGKFFKRREKYANHPEPWFVYQFVHGREGLCLDITLFQRDNFGEIHIRRFLEKVFSLGEEIEEEEFNLAWEQLVNAVQSVRPLPNSLENV
jgi:hypothetical protein